MHTNWKFAAVIGALATALNVWSQTIPLYENSGNINASGADVPQIDAISFANYGTFNVFTFTPYDTQNTLNFTNRGFMVNSFSGFEFDTTSPLGARRSAANFVNHRDARITAGTHFNIHATNIVNAGRLEVGGTGFLSLKGQKVNLSRGVLYIPSSTSGGGFVTPSPFPDPNTNFFPNPGITDIYWGGGEQTNVNQSVLALGRTVGHSVTNAVGFPNPPILFNTNSVLAYAFTNSVDVGTNTIAVYQIALLSLPGTNLTPVVNFEESSAHDFLRIINMGFSSDRTNILGEIETSYLFLKDRLAVFTNTAVSTNLNSAPVWTYRPTSYALTRANLGGIGEVSNAPFAFDYITNYPNRFVTNLYIAYAANASDQFVEIPEVPGSGSEDLPGRVTIEADSLNLDHTRIQGETYVKIHTKHLEGSANLAVQSQRLSYGLASTNGNLRIQNLVRSHVPRFTGTVQAYSAFWTNYSEIYITNTIPDPADPTITTNEITTNITPSIIHVAVMSANIATLSEVAVDDLIMYSTNMNVFDTINVTNGFYASGRNLTIEPSGSINFSGGLNNWRSTNAPAVLNFTNRGGLDIPNNVNLGQDRVTPYDAIVNLGSMSAASFQFKSKVFQNSGDISTGGGARIVVDAVDATLDGGGSASGGDTLLQGGGVKLRNYELNSDRALYLAFDNYIEDSGDGAGNTIVVNDGFHLSKQPAKGSLLGTTFQSTSPTFASVSHTWAGVDVGPTAAGFTNTAVNVAIGQLQLITEPNAEVVFSGTGTANALYVDYLSLPTADLDELPSLLRIEDNMVIYFADASIPPEQLDGQLNGRLRWVNEYAGPLSGMDVLLGNGSVIRVNRALRESITLDSDADGIPNGLDDAPFDGVAISSVSITGTSSPSAQITWEAAAGTVYTVEFATDVITANWQPLLNYTNTYSTNVTATITDPIAPNSGQRYYRVTYTP